MRIKRKSIGFYSKLRVGFCVINNKMDRQVFKYLTKKEYTFVKADTKVKGLCEYAVDVDSIEEACRLKSKIENLKHFRKI